MDAPAPPQGATTTTNPDGTTVPVNSRAPPVAPGPMDHISIAVDATTLASIMARVPAPRPAPTCWKLLVTLVFKGAMIHSESLGSLEILDNATLIVVDGGISADSVPAVLKPRATSANQASSKTVNQTDDGAAGTALQGS
ncbi:hypothetical protein V2G26_000383 [Clonostachys chloroleuca]